MKRLSAARYLVIAAAISISALNPRTAAAAPWQGGADGYPLSNFAVTAGVSEQGGLFTDVLHNRGKLGPWLTDMGSFSLLVEKDGESYALSSFAEKAVTRACPFVNAQLSGHPSIKSRVSYLAWAPAGLDDIMTTSLPVLQLEMRFDNPSERRESLTLLMRADSLSASSGKVAKLLDGQAVCRDNILIYCDKGINLNKLGDASVKLSVPAGGTLSLRLAVVLYDPLGYAARKYPDAGSLAAGVVTGWESLKESTLRFEAALPDSGYSDIDGYLRWYMIPALALTRTTAKGQVLTLGYCELNQRDSYWASWLHLDLFPSAERLMIEESVAGMRQSGKIPTCLLPRIDRKDDIDINSFFLLRCYRYYRHFGDKELITRYWEPMKRAADWLMALDTESNGLPRQRSSWADWKDVSGVKGRSYSPFACMVYLAAMRRMAWMARALGDEDAARRYEGAFERGYVTLNKPLSEGGLWNGRYYCQRWEDGRTDGRLLQDQCIGVFFGVVPRERAHSIFNSLNRNNLTPWGICETYPYWDSSFGYEPATYHNGGVWPWLSFMDDWSRILTGRRQEALDLVRTVARADLVDSGDWSANEHLNSLTGENLGFQLQGWDAALYGLVRFGLCGSPAEPRIVAEPGSTAGAGSAAEQRIAAGAGSAAEPRIAAGAGSAAEPGSTAGAGSAAEPRIAAEQRIAAEPGSTAGTGSAAEPGSTAGAGSAAEQRIAAEPPVIPTANRYKTTHGPASGHLVIIGGGPVPADIWDEFASCAAQAAPVLKGEPGSVQGTRIVIITNASGDGRSYTGPAIEELRSRVGAQNVTVMNLRDIREANDPDIILPLQQADGVFFTGGRQWHISEVFLNTLAHQALNDLLSRGGAIGGTSAGASIQGSFLWRGDTKGSEITVGDHTQGLGFMKRTAIDQHLLVRGREKDLQAFIDAAPEYIGIGLDESTAVVVRCDSLRVLGASKAAIYRPGQDILWLTAGDRFKL